MADLAPSATCVTISYNPDTNQKVYTVEGAWNASTCYGQVMVIHTEWRDVLAAVDGGGGTTDPTPTTSQFTEQEVASLKYQAANPSPLNLSLADGAVIGTSILAVWASAFAFKVIGQMLSDHFSPSE